MLTKNVKWMLVLMCLTGAAAIMVIHAWIDKKNTDRFIMCSQYEPGYPAIYHEKDGKDVCILLSKGIGLLAFYRPGVYHLPAITWPRNSDIDEVLESSFPFLDLHNYVECLSFVILSQHDAILGGCGYVDIASFDEDLVPNEPQWFILRKFREPPEEWDALVVPDKEAAMAACGKGIHNADGAAPTIECIPIQQAWERLTRKAVAGVPPDTSYGNR